MSSAPHPTTLRELYGMRPPAQLVPATSALLLVDFQREFSSGRLPVEDTWHAVRKASGLRRWARAQRLLVIHVRQVIARADSPVFAAGSPASEIVPELTPEPDELVLIKHQAGAFSKTALDELLRARGVGTLVVAGIMTHLAVDTTARDAAVLGYDVIVAADACATRALPSPFGGDVISAKDVHRVALASLADRFATVLRVQEIERLTGPA